LRQTALLRGSITPPLPKPLASADEQEGAAGPQDEVAKHDEKEQRQTQKAETDPENDPEGDCHERGP